MADIFISYSRTDAGRIRPLVERWRAAGWTVFQDRDTPTRARWRDVIEHELATAGCVVTVWTSNSVKSEWVHKETQRAYEEEKLISVRLDATKPPPPYDTEQAADLGGPDSAGDIEGFRELLDVIARLLGKRNGVSLEPLADAWGDGLAVVLGCPRTHPNLGATVNMTCRFTSRLDQAATVHKLAVSITESEEKVSYDMNWSLVYQVVGGGSDHRMRWEEDNSLRIPPQGTFITGVQFRAPTLMQKVSWPEGIYRIRVRGWVNREENKEANLRCAFDAELDYRAAREILRHQRMGAEQWQAQNYSDNAYGVPFRIRNLRHGLPAA